MKTRRVNLKAILADKTLRRELMVGTIIATQAREGIETSKEQAERAYDSVQAKINQDTQSSRSRRGRDAGPPARSSDGC